jgi:hypothetical protein
LEISPFFDVVEIYFGGFAIKDLGHVMRGEDLEGPVDRLISWFGAGASITNQQDLDLMDVLSCNRDSWSFILVQNFSILHEKCATHHLDTESIPIST